MVIADVDRPRNAFPALTLSPSPAGGGAGGNLDGRPGRSGGPRGGSGAGGPRGLGPRGTSGSSKKVNVGCDGELVSSPPFVLRCNQWS